MALKEDFKREGNYLFKHRSYLPIIILILGLVVYILGQKGICFEYFEDFTYNNIYDFLCLLVGLLGLFIRFFVVGYADDNTSGKNTHHQKAESVNKTGIYSIVRHPLYLGNFLMWLSLCLFIGNLWFIIVFCLVYWLYYERIMYAEESYLTDKFGEEYLQWANSVPAFIPRMKNYRKSENKFSWKKALMSEKNSFCALMILFCLFDIVGKIANKVNDFNYVFMGLAIFSLIFYIIMKIIKKRY
ncbi:MAG: isoprenylcysteine carboxylmethyltransferase family protein [Bacteroidales bacterium]|jgi:protein-S-isoprenylcysteine O-methyltransferase Ste14|nr:isoprenylcysteine carboxylmethyltransferase family protein [Bacteroidales bacterium]